MAELWTYDRPSEEPLQLEGFEVVARDGSIGKVDEATYDVDASYIVVDTGPWIFGRKVLLPAGLVEEIDLDGQRIHVSRTKDEIKDGPEYDPEQGYDSTRKREYDTYYRGM
jgi:hypothetical protein